MIDSVMFVAVRIARPTADLDRVRTFYEHVVGLAVLWSFVDHDSFDGVIFGLPDERVQLELVHSPHDVTPTPTGEDALVLYHQPTDRSAELITRLCDAGAPEVADDDPTVNPYWPRTGARTFTDPDGYRLIVAGA